VMAGVTRSEVSSCYKVDVRWTNSTVMDPVTMVPGYEECHTLCQDQAGCEGWTWTSEENSLFSSYCWIFSDLGQTTSFPNCVSGPRSCLCSEPEECEVTADNELDIVPQVSQEEDCRDLCAANPDCSFYTWYDDTDVIGNVCVLLSACEERDSSCSSCHTAPVPCSQELPPTEALLITGGNGDSAGNSVEVFIPSTGQHCHLPDIPGGGRYSHTMDGVTLCGGYNTNTSTSCLTLTDGTWETSTTLQQAR